MLFVVPTIGTTIGGPNASLAIKFLANKLLGDPNATEDQLSEAILSMTAEQKIRLREIDQQYDLEMYRTDA